MGYTHKKQSPKWSNESAVHYDVPIGSQGRRTDGRRRLMTKANGDFKLFKSGRSTPVLSLNLVIRKFLHEEDVKDGWLEHTAGHICTVFTRTHRDL